MARTKDQAARREQLVAATVRVIAEHGLPAVRPASVADQAGVSHRLVAYYYPGIEALVAEAHEAAVDRYYWSRRRALEGGGSASERLVRLIRSGLPGPGDRDLSRVLEELGVSAGRSDAHATLTGRLFDLEVSLYLTVLEEGAADGSLRLAQPALVAARNLVALEDAYGMHLLARHSSVDAAVALDGLLSYVRTATGAPFPTEAGALR